MGVLIRQFSIGDIFNVSLGRLATGVAISEMSKANCLKGVVVDGDIDRLFAATGASTMNAACDVTFKNRPTITSLYYAIQESRIEANGATFTGTANVTNKFIVDHSTIYQPKSAPGTAIIVQNNASVF